MVGENSNSESTYKKIGLTISLLVHALLFAIVLLWPSLRYDFPPPGKEGILVVFGDTPESSDDSMDSGASDSSDKKEKKEKETEPQNKVDQKKEIKKPVENKSEVKSELVDEKNDVKVNPKNKDNVKQPKEAKPEKTIDEAKNEFSKLFSSRGTKNKNKGHQGDPLGSRDAKMLEGITRGKGEVGEGLNSRGVLFEPSFDDSSQKSGRVVVRVCINEKGNVISSRYTQRGSTTTDWELIAIAEKNAKKYRFTPSNKKEQCGTIIIDFIVN